jgi:predicted dehydrogenase
MPEWKKSRRTGGGVLLDLAPHHVDLVRYLCGVSIDEVQARIWSRRTEDDCAALQLRLSDGVTVQSFFSLCTVDEDTIEIYGDRGRLTLDRYSLRNVRFTSASHNSGLGQRLRSLVKEPLPCWGWLKKLRSPLHEPSYPAAMARFAARVRGSADEYPDVEDGLRCQEVLEAAEESSRTGMVVRCATLHSA